jgi:RND family efflux transporter MFP subunit
VKKAMKQGQLHASVWLPLRAAIASVLIVTVSSGARSAHAYELEGFTEPYRMIRVAADETGTIAEVFVREGQVVEAELPLARLNSDVHEALLAISVQNMEAKGQLDAAFADLRLRTDRLEKLRVLRIEGHARQEEVDRAASEYAVAAANVRTAQEQQVTRRLEYERTKTQIARRTIRAPISGVIVEMHRDVGEFLAPNSPDLLTLVQLDQLLANFTLTSYQADNLTLDQAIEVLFAGELQTTGTVEFISPVTNAESGTVLVKLRIENAKGRFRSGARCKIRLED